MTKVKTFTETKLERLDKEINYFLEESMVEVVNIAFHVENGWYYAMLVYKKNKK